LRYILPGIWVEFTPNVRQKVFIMDEQTEKMSLKDAWVI
jgi:hypothetical protein